MKRNIKYMALAVAGALLIGGCGADSNDVEKEDFPFSESTVPAQDQTQTDNSNDSNLESDASEEENSQDSASDNTLESNAAGGTLGEMIEGAAPTVSIVQDKKEWRTDDGNASLLQVSKSIVSIEDNGFDTLQNALQERWGEAVDLSGYEETLQMAQEDYNARNEEDKSYFGGYSLTETVELTRSDSSVMSFRVYNGAYTGGAHDNYGYSGVTFDVKSGVELGLADICSDTEDFYSEAVSYLTQRLEEDYGEALFQDYKDYVAGTFGEDRTVNWYLNAAGIVITYSPYEIGPYAMGTVEVTLPYERFAQYIKEDYLAPHSNIVAKVPLNNDISGLIGESGALVLEAVKNEYDLYEVTIVSERASEEIGSFGYFGDAYVIRRENGRSFLLTSSDYMSDDFVMNIYEVTNGELQKCDELSGARFSGSCMGIGKIGFAVQLNVLGTYSGNMVYLLDEEGKLVQTEDVYTIQNGYTMTVMKELPVVLEGKDTESKIAVGRKLMITGTDNKGTAYFELDNGEKGEIRYTQDDAQGQIMIDGNPETEYFDMIPYAG